MRLLFLATGIALTLAGCDSGGDAAEDVRISGRYTGSSVVGGATLNHVFVLQEGAGGAVTGDLTIINGTDVGNAYRYRIAGTRTGRTFDLDYGGLPDGLDYTGTVDSEGAVLQGRMDWREGVDPIPDYSVTVTRAAGRGLADG